VRAESEGALWAQTQSAYQIMHQRERKRRRKVQKDPFWRSGGGGFLRSAG